MTAINQVSSSTPSSTQQLVLRQSEPQPTPPNVYSSPQDDNSKFIELIRGLDRKVQEILNTEGCIEVELQELMRQIKEITSKAKAELKSSLEELFKGYKAALIGYHQTGLEPFKKQLERFRNELRKNLHVYEDLTYGFGQFEEHDGCSKQDLMSLMRESFPSDQPSFDTNSLREKIGSLINLYEDADYEKKQSLCLSIQDTLNDLQAMLYGCQEIVEDQKSAADMSEKLARRDVVQAIRASKNGRRVLDDFEDSLEKCKKEGNNFIELVNRPVISGINYTEITQQYVHTQECLTALELMKTHFTNICLIIQRMVAILDEKRKEKPQKEYKDPWDPHAVSALDKELERLNKLKESAASILHESLQLEEEILSYYEKSDKEQGYAQAVEENGRRFIKELKALKKKLKPSHQPKERIQTLRNNPQLGLDNTMDACLTKIIRLIRKKELNLEISTKRYDHVRKELRNKWEELKKAATAGEDQEVLIELYIDIHRMQKQYYSLWNKKVTVGRMFIGRIGEIGDVSDSKEVAYATTPLALYHSCVQIRHPLDSPFIEVIHQLAISGIGTGQWRYFFLVSNRSCTSFERGMFDVILSQNSIDRVVCDVESYRAAFSSYPIEQSTIVAQELPVENKDPTYYEIFNLSSLPPIVEGITFTPSIIHLYSLVAMHLAYATASDEKRVHLKLPSGHPIGAILVSKTGQILSWAVNTIDEKGNKDPVRHAEINAISSFFLNSDTQQIPEGAALFTSLKPCSMCAGGISDAGKGQLTVYYGQNDPPQENNTPNCSQVKMQIVSDIDIEYKKLKSQNPEINAAKSLSLLQAASQLKTKLVDLGKDNQACFDHIKIFWGTAIGEYLS